MKEVLKLQLSNRAIHVHVFRGGDGTLPALIFLPDLTGVGEVLLESARLMALDGFHVFVPDLFSEEGAARYCVRMLFDLAVVTNGTENPGAREVFEIIDRVKGTQGVDPARIGLIGQCLTGGFALHAALRDDVKAPVVFHHSLGISGSGMPANSARAICKPVQGHFVRIDPLCPRSRVELLENQMGAHLEVNYYDWLPHGIPHFFRRTEEGRRAYIQMMRFLKMHLA